MYLLKITIIHSCTFLFKQPKLEAKTKVSKTINHTFFFKILKVRTTFLRWYTHHFVTSLRHGSSVLKPFGFFLYGFVKKSVSDTRHLASVLFELSLTWRNFFLFFWFILSPISYSNIYSLFIWEGGYFKSEFTFYKQKQVIKLDTIFPKIAKARTTFFRWYSQDFVTSLRVCSFVFIEAFYFSYLNESVFDAGHLACYCNHLG